MVFDETEETNDADPIAAYRGTVAPKELYCNCVRKEHLEMRARCLIWEEIYSYR